MKRLGAAAILCLTKIDDLIELRIPFARAHLFAADGRSLL